MSGTGIFPGRPVPGWLYLCLAPDGGSRRGEPVEDRLEALLQGMDWRSHVVLIHEDRPDGRARVKKIAERIAAHLGRFRWTSVSLHPLALETGGTSEKRAPKHALEPVERIFQEEAYVEQSEPRLTVLPMAVAVDRLRGRHVLESVLARIETGEGDLLDRCRMHLVVDEERGTSPTCLRAWEEGTSPDDAGSPDVTPERCAECIRGTILEAAASPPVGVARQEIRRACFDLGLALSTGEEHRHALDAARAALDLSEEDRDRTAALVLAGTCHLALEDLEEAEAAFRQAGEYTEEPGLIAWYRGKVQFAWRDWIEALERFQEAADSASGAFSRDDLHFHMALCHVNLEEYDEAGPHLDRVRNAGMAAPVSFYRGVCELNRGRVDEALARFTGALRLGPQPEDLGRVRFYIATCHKELGRYDEAIAELLLAVETDPEDLANHNLLGFCYYSVKRHEEAVECFRRAVELEPSSAIDWANLGSNLRELGRTGEAMEMYRKALSLDRTIGFAWQGLRKLQESSK